MKDLTEARRKAWETRRAIYGSMGHSGSYSRKRGDVGKMLAFLVRLHVEGTLSEGQVAKVTGLHRVEIRRLSDKVRDERIEG